MHVHIKTLMLALIAILLFSACGPRATASAPVQTSEPVVAPVVTGSDAENLGRYIGLNYPPLPEGLTEQFAMLMPEANDHSLSLYNIGDMQMLWLSTLTHYDADGNAFWEVKDVLDLSDLGSGLMLLPDGCTLDGEPDSEILVAGQDEMIRLAWRANTSLNQFEVIPTQGIECHSDKGVILE